MTPEDAIVLGGWHPEYARVLAVAESAAGVVAVVDVNGDGADVNLDVYTREADGSLTAGSSGTAGSGWSAPDLAFACGEAEPGEVVTLECGGRTHRVTTGAGGWWAFVTRTKDPDGWPRRSP